MASHSEANPPSPNKRRKTLIPSPTSTSSSSSAGKIKIGDGPTAADSESRSCGICLSEDGKTIRGQIDSCDHYFCFVCIMEWAKVESRCPMCKRRFTAIRRPPKLGVFLAVRVVNVPVRNQVCHYFGNSTVGPPDPYSEVRCTVCKSERDESLLLLCDLCDAASHSYCVGLGATVPEGDWFCKDCTVSKAEHDKNETDTDCGNQISFTSFHKRSLAEEHVSILNIVRESRFRDVERPTTVWPHSNPLSSPIFPEGRANLADRTTEQGSGAYPSTASTAAVVTELGARTLRRCRHVHRRIQVLRENWNAYQSGSLRFSSGSVDSTGNTNQRHSSGANYNDVSGQSDPTRCSSQHMAAERGSSCYAIPDKSSYDVDKAWKMMDAAKSMERAREGTSIIHQSSKLPLSKVNMPRENAMESSSIAASAIKPLGSKDLGNAGPQMHYRGYSHVKRNDSRRSQIDVKQKHGIASLTKNLKFGGSSPSAPSAGNHELPLSVKVQTSVQVDVCHGSGGELTEENLPAVSSKVQHGHARSACLISPAGPVTAASNTSCAKVDVSSSSKMGLRGGKGAIEKGRAGTKSRRDDDAKSEIQSLVKLNLKLVASDRKLGVDTFKEIARLATHSILAACGLEQPRPSVRSFPSCVCCHTNQVQQLRMSTLVPGSCRECFYVFVKDVVTAFVVEKTGWSRVIVCSSSSPQNNFFLCGAKVRFSTKRLYL